LSTFNIRTNTISPGAIDVGSAMQGRLEQIKPEHHDEFKRLFADKYNPGSKYFQPLETIGQPQDIAWCAVYLASDEARFVTGQNIAVDGGVTTYLSGAALEVARHEKKAALAEELEAWIAAH
jgi:NAD(P)-dependent dehydrogenase (short-subunit alcohol dehydrogenase family)